ncbi:hypothetical protein R6Q59_028479 [Mikania micrantha]
MWYHFGNATSVATRLQDAVLLRLKSFIASKKECNAKSQPPLGNKKMAYAAMKPTKPGQEEPLEQIHKIRITLSSKNVKNLEKGN